MDPVTRIEGHLRIEVEVDLEKHIVTDAFSCATMFRGIEIILRGRSPCPPRQWKLSPVDNDLLAQRRGESSILLRKRDFRDSHGAYAGGAQARPQVSYLNRRKTRFMMTQNNPLAPHTIPA